MKRFHYLKPTTLKEALKMLDSHNGRARPFIGGTDLMVRVQKGKADLDAVVDLKGVTDISANAEKGEGQYVIGGRMVLSDLIGDEDIRLHYPALIDAASTVGSVQIRNRATLTGNICNASPAADTVPALIIYDAEVVIAGKDGMRTVALKDFFLGPGKTVCSSSELVVSIRIPFPEKPFGAAFGRMTRRKGVDLATINLACGIGSNKKTVFVFGAAGPTPVTAVDDSGLLADEESSEDDRDGVLKALIKNTHPISDVRAGKEYREAMLFSVGKRVLDQARLRYASFEG